LRFPTAMDDPIKNFWETEALCKSCGKPLRSQGYVWVDEHTFYFYLKCSRCGKRFRGKKRCETPYIADWSDWDALPVVSKAPKATKKHYATARRRKQDGSLQGK